MMEAEPGAKEYVEKLMARARKAQALARVSQEQVDNLVARMAYAIVQPETSTRSPH